MAAAAQSAPGSQTPAPNPKAWAEALDVEGSARLAADYQRQCAGNRATSDACEILRSLLVANVATTLDLVARSRDQRGAAQALAALDLSDEPAIFIAASRILGQFPTTPGIVDKVLPQLLDNPSIDVQRMAATLLSATPHAGGKEAGALWLANHSALVAKSPYDEYPDFPAHYAAMGFPKYPGATWFSPADSDRSIGWSTTDDVAAVTRWFSQAQKAEPMDAVQWQRYQAEQITRGFDRSGATRMQELMQKAMKGDKAALAEFEKLAAEMEKTSANTDAGAENGVDKVARPPDSGAADARWIIAQQKNGHVSRLVLVYPLPALQRTVIQLAWDLADYPSAWPARP
jgi:hypothetical protein